MIIKYSKYNIKNSNYDDTSFVLDSFSILASSSSASGLLSSSSDVSIAFSITAPAAVSTAFSTAFSVTFSTAFSAAFLYTDPATFVIIGPNASAAIPLKAADPAQERNKNDNASSNIFSCSKKFIQNFHILNQF